jgi:very-short-patch-repair endonuclease
LVPVAEDEPIEILVPGRHNSARLDGCRLTFGVTTAIGLPMGVPSTTRERTITELAGRLAVSPAVAMVEAVLRFEPDLRLELAREGARLPARLSSNAQHVLAIASDLSESVLESYARVLWIESGLPPPAQQAVIKVAGRTIARVDFFWPTAKLIVEVDGLAKYGEPGALQAEKARQNLLVEAGYTVLRFTWADITQRPDRVVAAVRRALRVVGK